MVMPRSRSRSLESMTRSATSSFSLKMPLWRSMASTRVVFPWSTCATIAMLRMEVLVIYTWGNLYCRTLRGRGRVLDGGDGGLPGLGATFGGLRSGLEKGRGRGQGFVIDFIGRDG